MEIMQKGKEWKNKLTQTHKTQYVLSWKTFWEKTKLEGEVASLPSSVWKYGCRYKEVMVVACGLL